MTKKVIFIDTETTGTDHTIHGIIQISAVIEQDGEIIDNIDLKLNPLDYAIVEPKALEVNGKTIEEIEHHTDTLDDFKAFLSKHCDPYNRKEKLIIAGYNVLFDTNFLRELWKRNNDNYYFSFFSPQIVDLYSVVCYLKYTDNPIIKGSPSLKLVDVYEHIVGEKFEGAHDSLADILHTYRLSQVIKEKLKL